MYSLQTSKIELESQILSVSYCPPNIDIQPSMNTEPNTDELQLLEELEELDDMITDEIPFGYELNTDCNEPSNKRTVETTVEMTGSEDEELAELEAMMN